MMLYLICCLGYVGLRQELKEHIFKGVYVDTELPILYGAAIIEVVLKVLFCPIMACVDLYKFIEKLDNIDTHYD